MSERIEVLEKLLLVKLIKKCTKNPVLLQN